MLLTDRSRASPASWNSSMTKGFRYAVRKVCGSRRTASRTAGSSSVTKVPLYASAIWRASVVLPA